MAADVSSLVRVLNRYKDDRAAANESPAALITRDLLGGGGGSEVVMNNNSNYNECQELDLDMQVPNGWEKRLDLKVLLFFINFLNWGCLFLEKV